ncbi:MAG: 5/3-nucleotidase, partial [Actinomycetota bacterium]|nr:5/3-nucleotidase [Actinomycetota bacterium]
DVPLEELRGLREAALAAFGSVQGSVADPGRGSVTKTFEKVRAGDETGTDSELVRSGWATVTPLAPLCQVAGVDLGGLAGQIGPSGRAVDRLVSEEESGGYRPQ